jgi:hypothetical protein
MWQWNLPVQLKYANKNVLKNYKILLITIIIKLNLKKIANLVFHFLFRNKLDSIHNVINTSFYMYEQQWYIIHKVNKTHQKFVGIYKYIQFKYKVQIFSKCLLFIYQT